jgi:chloramphenicol-sensitive protein RarD
MNNNQFTHGIFYALAAYLMWGIAPLYFKQLVEVPAVEILMHRIIWSGLILLVFVSLLKQWPKVRYALKDKQVMLVLLASSLLIGVNWMLFIWAVNNDHLLDASLGYFINPLLNVFLGKVFLDERLKKLQKIAVLLALSGVLVQVILFGEVPWLALALASSFGFYGLLRKRVAVDTLPGLLIETTMMLPLAVIYWALFASPASNMLTNELNYNALLIAAGAVTIAPLLCFTAAARRLPLSTLGFMQFIGPTLMFILAVNIYGEALEISKLISFSFIWLGLGVFVYDVLRQKS